MAGMDLYAHASKAHFTTERVVIEDTYFPFLGKFAVNNIEAGITTGSDPIEAIAKSKLYKDGDFALLNIEEINSNSEDLELFFTYQTPLELPQIEVMVNGHPLELDTEAIEEDIFVIIPQLLKVVQSNIDGQINKHLVQRVSAMINEKIEAGIRRSHRMKPPGAPRGDVPDFKWGISIGDGSYEQDLLGLNFGAYVTDPEAPQNTGYKGLLYAREEVDFRRGKLEKHDAAVAINQGLLNKVLKLSFNRGYFQDIKAGKESVTLTKSPQINCKRGSKNDKTAKVSLEVEYNVKGWYETFVNNPVRISFDVNAEFDKTPQDKFRVLVGSLDEDSIFIADRYIRTMPHIVKPVIIKIIKVMSRKLEGTAVVKEIPIPEKFIGLKLIPRDLAVDRRGYFKAFVDYSL